MKNALLASLLVGVSLLVGCGGGGSNSGGGGGGSTVTLISVAVTPATPSLAPGATQQFAATGNYSDGTTKSLTSTANWLSSNQSVATVNTSGLATAVAGGSTTISAAVTTSSGTVTGTTTLSVTSVTLVSIAVTPANPSVAIGSTQAFTATGTYSDGSTKNLTSSSNWLSSSGTVATISTSGLATGVGGGTTTITATSGSVSGTTTLTVVALQSITVTPPTATVAPTAKQQFTATGNYSDGSSKNLTTTVSWSASTGASVTSGGLATGVTPGATSTITATSGSISGTATLTVSNPLVSIAVTPSNATIAPNSQQAFTATGTYSDGTTKDLTASATWQSSNTSIASIFAGLAVGATPGTVTITATSGIVSGTASLTVANSLVSIVIAPANSSVAPGTKPQFTATGIYFDNSSRDITAFVAWSSSNTSVATISSSQGTQGLATAIAAGQTTITATCTPPSPACLAGNQISGTAFLTVTNASITSILVTPQAAPISLGLQQQYDGLATFSDGTQQDVTNIVTWNSSDTTRVTITTSGLATGVGVTSTPVTITARAQNGVTGSTTVTVDAANLVSIAIKPTSITKLAKGTSQQYSAIGTFNNGSTLDITNQVNWQSGDITIATVAQRTGLVKAATSVPQQDNNVNITASLQSVQQSITIDVTNASPVSLTVTPITATIPVGATQAFHATAVFNDGTSQDVSLDSSWASSNFGQAKVTFPGRVLGLAPTTPTVTVTAFFPGVSGAATLTVSAATLTSITLAPTQANLAPASTITFQATGHYSDGSAANLSGLATWTSDATAVATVINGVTLGESAGTANITASYQGQTGTAPVVVTSSPITSIVITPPNPTTYVGVALQLTASGTAGQQQINLTSSATWASSNPAVAIVSNANSRQGLATGVGTGSATITAVFSGITGTTNPPLSVSSATITKLSITPVSPTLSLGSSLQFTATGTFSDGKTVDLTTQVTWNSSASNVAPITSVGLASGAASGQTTISATFTQPGSNPITVSDQTALTVP
jgi:hypothetical protein